MKTFHVSKQSQDKQVTIFEDIVDEGDKKNLYQEHANEI